ncbi:hypothetical protein [Halosegnis marinus]|uniref:Uncharacterized protein n=1 Tax=Halosegnis marinus TaxID=3034023 RepID=A0ABD5ZLT9_9EURY|nr:hypothetical protein [Halosegnis sp. DT85]
MSLLDDRSAGRATVAATAAAGLVGAGFAATRLLRAAVAGPPSAATGEVALLTAWLSTVFLYTPFLSALLLVADAPTRRRVALAGGLVYAFDLAVVAADALRYGATAGVAPTLLALPLARVATVLGVATAAWLAYHGGYERVAAAADGAPTHPLFAVVADEPLGPGLTLRRGVVSAGLGAAVAVGGRTAVGVALDLLGAVGGSAPAGAASFAARSRNTVVPPADLPVAWLATAVLLSAVLLVAGPRLRARDAATGAAVVFAGQAAVVLAATLLAPARPLSLVDPGGPLLAPLGDVVLFLGIAAGLATWSRDRDGTPRSVLPSRA